MSIKILYVCHNNKGRSPALDILTEYFLEKSGRKGIAVDSAGVGTDSIISLRKRNPHISKMTRRILHSDYGLETDHMRIKHLGEVDAHWDAVLAVDRDTTELIEDHFPEFYRHTSLAKEFAGYSSSHDMEIHGPYHYQHDYSQKDWSDRLGYEIMLKECKNVARRIAGTL